MIPPQHHPSAAEFNSRLKRLIRAARAKRGETMSDRRQSERDEPAPHKVEPTGGMLSPLFADDGPICIPNSELLKAAEKLKPPPEWYGQKEDDLFGSPPDNPPRPDPQPDTDEFEMPFPLPPGPTK